MPQEEKTALFADYITDTTNSIIKNPVPVIQFDRYKVIKLSTSAKEISPEKKKLFMAMAAIDNMHKNKTTVVKAETPVFHNRYQNSRS